MALVRRPLGELPLRGLSLDGSIERSNYVRGSPLSASRPTASPSKRRALHLVIGAAGTYTRSPSASPSPSPSSATPSAASPIRITASRKRSGSQASSMDPPSGSFSALALASSSPASSIPSSSSASSSQHSLSSAATEHNMLRSSSPPRESSKRVKRRPELRHRPSMIGDMTVARTRRVVRPAGPSALPAPAAAADPDRTEREDLSLLSISSSLANATMVASTPTLPTSLEDGLPDRDGFTIFVDPPEPEAASTRAPSTRDHQAYERPDEDQENVAPTASSRRERSRSGSPLKQLSASSDEQ